MLNLNQPRPPSQLPDINLQSLFSLAMSTPPGDFIELGVYKGGSAWVLDQAAKARGFTLHLYDTFTGIPEKSDIDGIGVGAFADVTENDVRAMIPSAIFHVGTFPNTLSDEPREIAFAHIDCDQYASCRVAIERLWPRILNGGVIAFDDYPFAGIKKAIHDYFGEGVLQFTPANIPYVRKGAG